MKERVTYEIMPYYNAHYRVEVYVDGYRVDKRIFATYPEAETWAQRKVKELQAEVARRESYKEE